jgi:hypothetical protein
MFCTNCGLRMEAGDKFCARCGTPARLNVPPVANIEETPPAAASQPEEPPVQAAVRISHSTAEVAHQSLFHATSFSDAARSARPQAEAAPQVAPANAAEEDQFFAESAAPIFADAFPEPVPQGADAGSVEPVRNLPTAYDNLPTVPYAPDAPPPRDNSGRLLLIGFAAFLLVALAVAVWITQGKTYVSSSSVVANGAHDSGVTVTLTPATARVTVGNGVDFTASVGGTDNPEIMWGVQEGDEGGHVVSRGAQSKGGRVSQVAVYVAPSTPGKYHVTAASKADLSATASAEVTVTPR